MWEDCTKKHLIVVVGFAPWNFTAENKHFMAGVRFVKKTLYFILFFLFFFIYKFYNKFLEK